MKRRAKNRLTACLKTYFPQLLQWFDDIDAPVVEALLNRWPTLQKLQHDHARKLRKFFLKHNSRSAKRTEERIKAIYQAVPVTDDQAVLLVEAAAAASFAGS